jgi:hypothetical protein
MMKFSCTMTVGEDLHFVTLIAENEQQAKEMAVAEKKVGMLRNWSVAVLERDVSGPAQIVASGSREL